MDMDVSRFREVLRELRKERVGSQGALSALTRRTPEDRPVNAMTISEIETGAIADPGVVTVARIIEAIPGVTLSSFFAQIEGLPAPTPTAQTLQPPELSEQVDADERAILAKLPADARTSRSTMAIINFLIDEILRARAAAKVRGSASGDRLDPSGRSEHRVRNPRPPNRNTRKRRRRKE